MKRITGTSARRRAVFCPQCNKQRMYRSLDHEVSLEKQDYEARDGSTVTLHTDICQFCKERNWTRYFEPSRTDIRRVLKGMHKDAELEDNESLEDLL